MQSITSHRRSDSLARRVCARVRIQCLLVLAISLVATGRSNAQNGSILLQPPRINGTNVIINWNGGGSIQLAPEAGGPWTTVTSGIITTSSFTAPIVAPARFARVVINGVAGDPVAILPDAPFDVVALSNATVQLLPNPVADGNAVIRARLEPGQNISNNITLLVDDRVLTLRDDGVFPDTAARDQRFAGIVQVEVEELEALNAGINSLPAARRIAKVFNGRRVVGTNAVVPFGLSNFTAGAEITFINSPCSWGSFLKYDWKKTLLINDLSVVQDVNRTWDPCPNYPAGTGTKMGAWTFGRLMTDMANTPRTGISPSDFVRNWLRSWQFNQTVNSDTVNNRNAAIMASLINTWQTASGGPNAPLDLSIAPFRLLAIVNRVDLRGNVTYGGGSPRNPCDPPCVGGESRFVFCGVTPDNCNDPRFIIILEYCNPAKTCKAIRSWAAQWAALNTIPFSPAYNAALQAITDQFATANKNPSQQPNQSLLNQLRSNEFLNNPWELREWHLVNSGSEAGHLKMTTVAQTPDVIHNNNAIINRFISVNAGPLLTDPPSHKVPLLFPRLAGEQGISFLGASAPVSGPGFFWNGNPSITAPIADSNRRHNFSITTCNGCHGGETGTIFTHVDCRAQGFPAPLSGFLTGLTGFPDPAGAAITRDFADMDRRVQDLDCVVNTPCFFSIGFLPLIKAFSH